MNNPRTIYLPEHFWNYQNYKQMGKAVYLFIDLLSVADDGGFVRASFRELSVLAHEPVPKLRRWLKRLRDYEYIVVQGRGTITIVVHPEYVIPQKLRKREADNG